MILDLEIFLPFRDDQYTNLSSKELIDEMLSLSESIQLPIEEYGKATICIEKTSPAKSLILKEEYPTYFKEKYLNILHFSSQIEFTEIHTLDSSNTELLQIIDNEIFNRAFLTSIFQARLFNFIVFTQLAIPGSLNVDKGIFLKDSKFHSEFKSLNSNLSSLGYEEKPIWPEPLKLSIIKVWDYITKKTKILDSFSSSKIENGLNAFTYLFNDSNNFMQNLLWAMSGIQALYADSEVGIAYQIDRKSRLFIGDCNNKKIIKKLYDFRSKFLHGSMNIPINDGWLENDDEDKFDDEFYRMDLLASKILTVTLQKIINMGLIDFDFEFKLK